VATFHVAGRPREPLALRDTVVASRLEPRDPWNVCVGRRPTWQPRRPAPAPRARRRAGVRRSNV
jgi:hypothetical protein